MDNNRDSRTTTFENDLQNLLSDYLTRNLNGAFNRENNNTEPIFTTHRPRQPSYNDDGFVHNNYSQSITRVLDSMDRTMTTYQNNMSLYLNTMNRMINNLNTQETNRTDNRHNTAFRPNPLRPSHNIRTNTAQPMRYDHIHTNTARPTRYDHILTYALPPQTDGLSGANNGDFFNSLFQNVVVRPSQEQIEAASEEIIYDMSMNLINQRCPITLEEFEVGNRLIRLNYCGHTFTESSFTNWFQSNVRCPVCRHDIRNDHQNSNIDNESDDADPVTNTDTSMNTDFQLFSDSSNSNLFDLINTNIQTLLDPSSNLGFRLEIPIQYSEVYDMSDNFIGRTFP